MLTQFTLEKTIGPARLALRVDCKSQETFLHVLFEGLLHPCGPTPDFAIVQTVPQAESWFDLLETLVKQELGTAPAATCIQSNVINLRDYQ